MCGIVGLFLKDKSLEPKLGELLSEMLVSLSDRGPDSAGIAIYGSGEKKKSKITIQSADPDSDFAGLGKELEKAIGSKVEVIVKSTHAVIEVPTAKLEAARDAILELRPAVRIMGAGEVIEIFKEVGLAGRCGEALQPDQDVRHARHRPHPHGDRERRHHHGRASLLDRAGPVPGAQRLAVEPQQCPPRAEA